MSEYKTSEELLVGILLKDKALDLPDPQDILVLEWASVKPMFGAYPALPVNAKGKGLRLTEKLIAEIATERKAIDKRNALLAAGDTGREVMARFSWKDRNKNNVTASVHYSRICLKDLNGGENGEITIDSASYRRTNDNSLAIRNLVTDTIIREFGIPPTQVVIYQKDNHYSLSTDLCTYYTVEAREGGSPIYDSTKFTVEVLVEIEN